MSLLASAIAAMVATTVVAPVVASAAAGAVVAMRAVLARHLFLVAASGETNHTVTH